MNKLNAIMHHADTPENIDRRMIDQLLTQAIAHHNQGQLQDAARLYMAILATWPAQPDAHHNLGVLTVQFRQPLAALPRLRSAVLSDPSRSQYWRSYIQVLRQTGQNETAERSKELARQFGADISDLADRGAPSPEDRELSAIVALFERGLYAEAAGQAQSLTDRFPRHPFGWKALGTSLLQMGRDAQAIPVLERAAELAPMDVDIHYNLGLIFQNRNDLSRAETHYRHALALRANDRRALNNLGLILQTMERRTESLACYRSLLEFWPGDADGHTNLGNLLKAMGQLDGAEASYRRAQILRTDHAESINNSGRLLHQMGKADEARAHYIRALKIRPLYPDAFLNLGNSFRDIGRLTDAADSYRKALGCKPDHARALLNLGHILCDLDDLDLASASYRRALFSDRSAIGFEAATYLAIIHYLQNNMDKCKETLASADCLSDGDKTADDNSIKYHLYMKSILDVKYHSPLSTGLNIEDLPMTVVGESHSLSAHDTIINFDNKKMRCASEWIPGCKQWHLGNQKNNRYKMKFTRIMNKMRQKSTFLLLIGEIDCRADEGIISAWKKQSELPIEHFINSTVDDYIDYIISATRPHGHKAIIGGVPCINIPLNCRPSAEIALLVRVVTLFNARLLTRARASGLGFLDLFAMTNRGDGISNGKWHMDDHHLLPAAMAEAFERHYVSPAEGSPPGEDGANGPI